MSTPAKQPMTGPRTRVKPQPQPVNGGGQPANGKHVPSNVPGQMVHDNTRSVGSNITCKPGTDMDSGSDVLAAPPWAAAYPTPGIDQDPMY